jgi:hypothetical protein
MRVDNLAVFLHYTRYLTIFRAFPDSPSGRLALYWFLEFSHNIDALFLEINNESGNFMRTIWYPHRFRELCNGDIFCRNYVSVDKPKKVSLKKSKEMREEAKWLIHQAFTLHNVYDVFRDIFAGYSDEGIAYINRLENKE